MTDRNTALDRVIDEEFGELSGTGNPIYVVAYLESGSASFTGFEKVMESLDGRRGSFVLRHMGTYGGATATAA